MKALIGTFLLLIIGTESAHSQDKLQSVASCREMLGHSPSRVVGKFQFGGDLHLLPENSTYNAMGWNLDMSAKIKANREIDYSFNRSELLLTSPEGGFKVQVGVAVVTIPWIKFDKETQKFDLGAKFIGQYSDGIAKRIKKELNERIAPTTKKAMNDFFQMVETENDPAVMRDGVVKILNSFQNPASNAELPPYIGTAQLDLKPTEHCKTQVGPIFVDVEKDHVMTSRISFKGDKDKHQTTALKFQTNPHCMRLSIVESGDIGGCIKGVSISEKDGLQLWAENDVDLAAATVGLLIHTVNVADGRVPARADCTACSGIGIQDEIDQQVLERLIAYIHDNRQSLLANGFSNELLNAILTDRTSAINFLEFSDYIDLPDFPKQKVQEANRSGINRPDFCLSC